MENKIKLDICNYSKNPGPRYKSQGDDSGEDFYDSILKELFKNAISQNKKLFVDLDGTNGYASSFLDEAFGNLIYEFGLDAVLKNIEFKSDEEPEWIDMIKNQTFIEWEERREKKKAPTRTEEL